METVSRFTKIDLPLVIGVFFLITFSVITLRSIAGFLFPQYLLYILIGVIAFIVFVSIDFEILSLFSKHLFVLSLLFLLLPLLIGQVSRGAVRWITFGALSIQPAEIVRPFILLFFANFLTMEPLSIKLFFKSIVFLALPLILILLQPSLGVAILMMMGFLGVLISIGFNKKVLLFGALSIILMAPIVYNILAPYQQDRIQSFINPQSDPLGTGYNSIQSMISVGSGKIFGRGLGKGVQTQLAFLPEKHTDFIFASVSEELGFLGSALLLFGVFFVLFRLTKFIKEPESPPARAFLSGLFLTLFVQTIVNIGMNLGLTPITGLPLPLVSAGGSSFLSTMMSLGIAVSARK